MFKLQSSLLSMEDAKLRRGKNFCAKENRICEGPEPRRHIAFRMGSVTGNNVDGPRGY